jgi:hypothetical protein
MRTPGRETRYAVVLLLVSAAILVGGSLIRKYVHTPKLAPPAPPDLERLQRLTAERRLRDLSAYLAELADTDAARITTDGLIWDSTTVVAPPFDLRRAENPNTTPPSPDLRLNPGDWLIAVARGPAGKVVFSHGIFQARTPQTCGSLAYDALQSDAALTPALIGGGLFTIEGALAGFIGDCDGRPIPIASSTIAARIAHPPSEADLLEHRYGIRLAPDPPGLVVSVWADSSAAAAGIQPGDVLDPSELSATRFTVKRRGRPLQLTWAEPDAARGLSFDGTAPVVHAVDPDSPAARSTLVVGDRLLEVADAPVTTGSAAARAIQRAKGAVTLTVERSGRRLQVLLQP